MSAVSMEAGEELDHYRIDAPVSESGMATIFRATDMRDGRQVAIKIPHPPWRPTRSRFDRFKREEEIGSTLEPSQCDADLSATAIVRASIW